MQLATAMAKSDIPICGHELNFTTWRLAKITYQRGMSWLALCQQTVC